VNETPKRSTAAAIRRKAPPATPEPAPAAAQRVSKKSQIISLFTNGIQDLQDIACVVNVRPSYVASVLTEADLLKGYHDLFTTTSHPMNVYSKFFAGQLGFRDEETARASVALIDRYYRQFALAEDRAGQHHALLMALTMFDRARWTNKPAEAALFRNWLTERLAEPLAPAEAAPSPRNNNP
jgi:hypothetical protein